MAFDGLPITLRPPAHLVEKWRRFLAKHQHVHATIDFETRSELDLTRYDTWNYAAHPTTEALCLAYNLPDSDEVHLWHRGHAARTPWNQDAPDVAIPEAPPPMELLAFIEAGGLVEAHNVMFERMVWHHVMNGKHGWPDLPPGQLRCSASRASYCALPRSLEEAVKSMALPIEKDMEGRRLMLKMTKPRKPRKDEVEAWQRHCVDELLYTPDRLPKMPTLWHETEEAVYRNHDYCRQDVRAEMALSAAIPELSPRELEIWQLDQEMNWRGVRVDLELARKALKRAEEWKRVLNQELFALTGVERGSQREQVKAWLKGQGVDLPDTSGETIEWFIDNVEMDGRCLRVLEIMKQVNKTSTRKYQAMLDKTGADGYARNLLMYHGASTGRWAGKGIQVHNFPRGKAKNRTYIDKEGREQWTFDMDRAVEELKSEASTEAIGMLSGDVMELLSTSLRGALLPSEGHDMIAADYSAIEARCVLWEAGEEEALEIFRSGGDIYCALATIIYGYEVTKKHANERQFGKQAILGLGYGMGFITFLLTCKKYNISFSVDQVKAIVKNYHKYEQWLDNYLWPKRRQDETITDYKKRKQQASRNIAMLRDARLDAVAVKHELILMKYTVDLYRKQYPRVKAMWAEQETAAMEAVRAYQAVLKETMDRLSLDDLFSEVGERARSSVEGPEIEAGKYSWFVSRGWLCCRLPSGRLLRYRDPFLKVEETAWGEKRESLRYYTVGVGGRWTRTSTYGGKIVENQTQAVARDVMADAMLGLRKTKYRPLITVHDENVSEVPVNEGNVKEFETLMCTVGDWADGCPIVAEAKIMKCYRK